MWKNMCSIHKANNCMNRCLPQLSIYSKNMLHILLLYMAIKRFRIFWKIFASKILSIPHLNRQTNWAYLCYHFLLWNNISISWIKIVKNYLHPLPPFLSPFFRRIDGKNWSVWYNALQSMLFIGGSFSSVSSSSWRGFFFASQSASCHWTLCHY